MKFEDLVGQEFEFFGVDGNTFKIGESVFEALEDPDDGMRSHLDSVEVKDPSGLLFFNQPLAKVKLESEEDTQFSGYRFVDVIDGHVWLRLGTDNNDDYYPCFLFTYEPRK